MPAQFSIAVSPQPHATTIWLAGELDIVTAPKLRQRLATVHGPVIFDLEQLSFIDGAGLGPFVETQRNNGGVQLRHPRPFVRRVLDICDMADWISGGEVQ